MIFVFKEKTQEANFSLRMQIRYKKRIPDSDSGFWIPKFANNWADSGFEMPTLHLFYIFHLFHKFKTFKSSYLSFVCRLGHEIMISSVFKRKKISFVKLIC